MKKIVSAAVAATLLAGAAFAEVTLSTNYRLGTHIITIDPAEKDGAKDKQYINDMYKSDWTDTTKISAKGDHAGIEYDLKTSESSISMDYGFAWLNWGSFTLYGGKRDERGFIKLVNPLDGNWNENYCGYGKPGLHKDLKKVAIDASNVTVDKTGAKAVNFTTKYAIDDKTNVNVAFFKNSTTSEKLADVLNVAAQFNMKQDAFILNATAKFSRNEESAADDAAWSFGAYANIIAVDGLDMLLGVTLGKDEAVDKDNTFTGIDARFSFKQDALTAYSLNNITLHDGDMISWHTLGAAYKVSDVITAAGVQAIINSGATPWSDADVAGKNTEYLAIRPYVDLTAQKNAVLSIGAEFKLTNFMKADGEKTDFVMTVPMVMRVKM